VFLKDQGFAISSRGLADALDIALGPGYIQPNGSTTRRFYIYVKAEANMSDILHQITINAPKDKAWVRHHDKY